jgi:hypothetical protein
MSEPWGKKETRMDISNWQNQVTPQHGFKQANVKIKMFHEVPATQ